MITLNGAYVGDIKNILDVAINEYNCQDVSFVDPLIFRRKMKDELPKFLREPGRDYVFIDFIDSTLNEPSIHEGNKTIELENILNTSDSGIKYNLRKRKQISYSEETPKKNKY